MFRDDSMPLILSIETATRGGSLAVTRGERVLAARRGDAVVSHSTSLLEQLKEALDEISLSLRSMDALAVACGPGSFTGLRIGLATVKAFAATLDLPCVGVQTLHAVAHAAGESDCTVALLPAGRGEVYAQRLSVTSGGDVEPLEPPAHLSPELLLGRVGGERKLKWAGEGAQMYLDAIRNYARALGLSFREQGGEAQAVDDEWFLTVSSEVLAASVGRLADKTTPFQSGASPQDLRAIYVRPSDAEINR